MRCDRWISWGFEIVIKLRLHVCCVVYYHLSYLFPVFNHKSPEWLKVISHLCAALLPFAQWGRKNQNKWKIQIYPLLPTELQRPTNRHYCRSETDTACSLTDNSDLQRYDSLEINSTAHWYVELLINQRRFLSFPLCSALHSFTCPTLTKSCWSVKIGESLSRRSWGG